MADLEIPGYQIRETLGRGGMGVVYKAVQTALDRVVAIKVLPPHLAEDREFVNSFAQEARTVAKLDHPNIVSVIDYGNIEGAPYFVMQYVEGRTLRELLNDHPPDVKQCISILKQVAAALDYAHSREVVHRDVKPSNIMLCLDGKAMIMDFGVACGSHPGDSSGEWSMVGTPTYMSPEQCRGGKASPRSDQYALGVTAYEMLSGKLPFRGSNASTMLQQHISSPPPSLLGVRAGITMAMEAAIFRAMSKLPEMRFGTVSDFARELDAGFYEPGMELPAPATALATASMGAKQGGPVCLVGGTTEVAAPAIRTVHTYSAVHAIQPRRSEPRGAGRTFALVVLLLGGAGCAGWFVYPKIVQATHKKASIAKGKAGKNSAHHKNIPQDESDEDESDSAPPPRRRRVVSRPPSPIPKHVKSEVSKPSGKPSTTPADGGANKESDTSSEDPDPEPPTSDN